MGAFGRLMIQTMGGNLKAYDNAGYSSSNKITESYKERKEREAENDRLKHLNDIKKRCIQYNNAFRVDESWFEFDNGTIDTKSWEEFKQWKENYKY